MKKTCETCDAFQLFKVVGGVDGLCRRRPPVFLRIIGDHADFAFPQVTLFEWCKKWTPRIDEKPPEDDE